MLILRIGLYEPTLPKLRCEDRGWIADHTIGGNTTNNFMVLGIRRCVWAKLGRPMEHRDLETLAMILGEKLTGETVGRLDEANKARSTANRRRFILLASQRPIDPGIR